MKKNYLLIAAAAALFAACAETDNFKEIDTEDVLIGFETFHEKATKAAVSAGSDLTSANGGFGVFGYNHDDSRTVSSGSINMTTAGTSNVFNNVKVWYENASTLTKGFTYDVPKYWNKNKYYTFFAYAPWNESTVTLAETTGKFTRTDVQSLQSTNATTTVTVGSNDRTQYTTANETSAIDYLFAVCVSQQKYAATNQSTYTGYQKTVGFTFSHILSKLNVTVQAKDESTGHEYKGVKDIQVTSLNIENLPNAAANVTYTQTATDDVAGDFTPAHYTTNLNIISGTNALTAGPLYVLDGGANGTPVTAPTTYINQAFHYWVAPNSPDPDDNAHNKYKLNINYTINYVDNVSDSFTRTIDLSTESAAFTTMAQNYIYNITVTIGLDQIYFNVDAINGWATPQNTNVEID